MVLAAGICAEAAVPAKTIAKVPENLIPATPIIVLLTHFRSARSPAVAGPSLVR
jgi:hypothetical protein